MSNITEDRRAKIVREVATVDGSLDAMLVTDPISIRYLSGFTGSNAALLIWVRGPAGQGDLIATDGRYTEQIAAQSPDLPVIVARDCARALLDEVIRIAPNSRVGFESTALTVAEYQKLSRSSAVDLVPRPDTVQRVRELKDSGEVELITDACDVGDRALAALIERGSIRVGRTEREVARELEWEMYALGADAIAFETIVAAGPNSAIPHHRPTTAVLDAGDLVKIDFGAVVGGYHSDMTRTFVLGEPEAWQREIYDIVATAQAAGRSALSPGARLADIDAAARTIIADAGYGENYPHGLGHGVGLEIHEAPGIGSTADGTLHCGATVTVEPGIYLPGRGGVRIEDTLLVTDSQPRTLTTTERTLRVL